MKSPVVLATLPLWFLLVSATTTNPTPGSPTPSAVQSPSPVPSPSPAPSPSPSPIPTNAFLTIDVTTGPVTTDITVSGGAFLANEQMTLYWDPPSTKVAGGANADASGNFTTHVKPFASDAPGIHHLCASVAPFPCANFTLVAATPSPSPSPSPSPDTSPSPLPSPSDSPTAVSSPTPIAGTTLSGIDLITRPPFVFIPIIGVLAILAALAYWIFSMFRRPAAPAALPTAAVVHRATRPDYTAEFGTPPPAPAPAPPPPSAWDDVMPPAQPMAATPPPPASVEPPAPATDVPAAADEPPDLPEPGED